MNIITHVFKKDLIRLRYLLIVWLLLIVVQLALGIYGQRLAVETFELQMFFPLLTKLVSFLQGLMMIVIIPLIIQDDSVVGTTAFWFTRPISRKGLLGSKACTILAVLVLPLLAAELFVLGANGASGYQLLLAIPEVIIEKLAYIIPFAILASVTPKFSRYALVGIIVFAIVVVVMILLAVVGMIFPALRHSGNQDIYKIASLEASYTVAKHLYEIILGVIIISYQFMTRRTARTAMLVVGGYLLMWVGTNMWNIDFLKERSVVEGSTIKVKGLSLDIDPQYLTAADEFRFTKKDTRDKSISTRHTVDGLADGQFAILTRMNNANMKYADGEVLKSKYVSVSKYLGYHDTNFMSAIQNVLGDIKLVNPSNDKFSNTEIFSTDKTNLDKHKNQPGTYSVRADVDVYEYEVVLEIPLNEGKKGSYGAEQIVIYDVLERDNNTVSVILHEKKINLLFDRRFKKISRVDMAQNMYSKYSPVYLLVNKMRGEAFLPEASDNMNINPMDALGPSRLMTKSKLLDFTDRNFVLYQLDDEWLGAATLVRMNAVLKGTAVVNFTSDGFILPSKSTQAGGNLDKLDQQLRMQDKNMQRWTPEEKKAEQ
ncbi:MAG: hypothetical protein KAJ07_06130 [Planctomycetes bacterium]|nr:hypothetical protein [Planctomycetota bacterium]